MSLGKKSGKKSEKKSGKKLMSRVSRINSINFNCSKLLISACLIIFMNQIFADPSTDSSNNLGGSSNDNLNNSLVSDANLNSNLDLNADSNSGSNTEANTSPALAVAKAADQTTPENQQAFEKMLKDYFPLTPSEIQEFKDRAAVQAQANARPAGDAPAEGVSGTIQVSMKPGDAMPVIRIGQGMITSLIFTDAAGQVWPVSSYSLGDPSALNIQWDKKSGVMMVQGQKLFSQTNMGVVLQGMQVPVMLTLLIGQKTYDYMDYVRIQAYQSADQEMQNQVADEAPDYLVKVLDGLPPSDATTLEVSGGDAQMWSYQGTYLLLTRSTLLSPAWTAKFVGTGPAPMHVYQLSQTPYILLSNNGQVERVTVTGGDENA